MHVEIVYKNTITLYTEKVITRFYAVLNTFFFVAH